ncbi:MAG TPA: hypothetical protein ENK43_04365 [Planctomycetes bacterium]|nr:hypothetical protein [Planctomycetota bacterium]
MSAPIVYYGHVKVGDYKVGAEKFAVEKRDPEFRGGTWSERAHWYFTAPAGWFEMAVKVAFQRDRVGGETIKSFWRRLRTWQRDLLTSLPLGAQPLVFVRDPDGVDWGEADETTVSTLVAPTDPLPITTVDAGWSIGDYVLLLDATDPKTFHEVVVISAIDVPGKTITTPTRSFSYGVGSKVFRADWHLPGSLVVGNAELPVSGPDPSSVIELTLTFRSTQDPAEGVST